MRTYDEEFVQKVKDYATMGLTPRQIADRMELVGDERRDFLMFVATKEHPLHSAFIIYKNNAEQDPHAALVAVADAGDTDALELLAKVSYKAKLDDLKEELFGI